jgi:hypothetical protein
MGEALLAHSQPCRTIAASWTRSEWWCEQDHCAAVREENLPGQPVSSNKSPLKFVYIQFAKAELFKWARCLRASKESKTCWQGEELIDFCLSCCSSNVRNICFASEFLLCLSQSHDSVIQKGPNKVSPGAESVILTCTGMKKLDVKSQRICNNAGQSLV